MDSHDKKQDRYHSEDETNKRNELGNRDDLDSKVNTDFSKRDMREKDSLTNDESADTDPNEVPDKPTFN